MIVALLVVLAVFDALLAGFRAAAGRDGRIDKRAYFRAALLRGIAGGVIVVAIDAALVGALVATADDGAAAWHDMLAAAYRCVIVFGGFAAAVVAATAFWCSSVPDIRVLASILVLGPLTLARPLVIAGGLAAGAAPFGPRVWIAAVLAGASMLGLEPVLGRLAIRGNR